MQTMSLTSSASLLRRRPCHVVAVRFPRKSAIPAMDARAVIAEGFQNAYLGGRGSSFPERNRLPPRRAATRPCGLPVGRKEEKLREENTMESVDAAFSPPMRRGYRDSSYCARFAVDRGACNGKAAGTQRDNPIGYGCWPVSRHGQRRRRLLRDSLCRAPRRHLALCAAEGARHSTARSTLPMLVQTCSLAVQA